MKRMYDRPHYYETDHHKFFGKKILSIVPHIHPYIKHRLYIAERTGILPKNMYCSNGIIDDAIVALYQDEELDTDIDRLSLELLLFRAADHCIDELYFREGFHKQCISTNYFLKEELQKLEETFSYTSDYKTVMNEDLDDISYHQGAEEKKETFIYDDTNSAILKLIEPESSSMIRKQELLGKFYSWLPLETSKIIDLFVFGKLNFEEIGKIRGMSAYDVKETIINVRSTFRKNL